MIELTGDELEELFLRYVAFRANVTGDNSDGTIDSLDLGFELYDGCRTESVIPVITRNTHIEGGLYCLPVMRYTPGPAPSRDRRSLHSLQTTTVGTVLAALLVPVLVLAILYPAVGVGVVALALASTLLVRIFRRLYHARQRQGRTRRVCLPKTGVCVEV